MSEQQAAKRPICALCDTPIPLGEVETNPNIVNLKTREPATVCKQWYDQQDRQTKAVYEGCGTRTRRRRKHRLADILEERLDALPAGPHRNDLAQRIVELRA